MSDRSRPEVIRNANYYTVRKGDTLFAIAWRHGMNFRTLAQMNGIDSRYQIYPGQKLALKAGASNSVKAIQNNPVRQRTVAGKSVSKPLKTTSLTQTSSTRTKTRSSPSAPKSKKSVVPVATIRWQWPNTGKLVASFRTSGKVNKGINLTGRMGDPIFAAATGEVVYAGSGLLGYGNLVIVDHNQKFLSAYAHNSRVLVKESDKVKVGQKIAEMGRSGADRIMLHFEIRRDGIPVNPLRYLPKKQ